MGLGSVAARLSGALTPLITLLDSFDPTIPAITFGVVTLVSGTWVMFESRLGVVNSVFLIQVFPHAMPFQVMFLPETNGQPMPESIEDGEKFGVGDTCFSMCMGSKKKSKDTVHDEYQYAGVPMENVDK